ncbi:hypothetical protein DUI87_01651 [Hirundo rustica rustica]|uniref:Uncharacterized protein n=1 Tax=Hirundo rustica rustica TaxID=333673 RepID=A0A3M0L5L9_HIRRU|nr:hypothetical protein DUI87_01651 [Hirundo rustica rustica]
MVGSRCDVEMLIFGRDDLDIDLRLQLTEGLHLKDDDWNFVSVDNSEQGTWPRVKGKLIVVGDCKHTPKEIEILLGTLDNNPGKFILWLRCTHPPIFLPKGQIVAQIIPTWERPEENNIPTARPVHNITEAKPQVGCQAVVERTHREIKRVLDQQQPVVKTETPQTRLARALFTLNFLNSTFEFLNPPIDRHFGANPQLNIKERPPVMVRDPETGRTEGPHDLVTWGRGWEDVSGSVPHRAGDDLRLARVNTATEGPSSFRLLGLAAGPNCVVAANSSRREKAGSQLSSLIYLLVVSVLFISPTLGDMGIYMTDFDR